MTKKHAAPQSSLLPCPFCGSKDHEIISHKLYPLVPRKRFGISCCEFFFDCRAKTKAGAILIWNCRVNEGPKRDAAFEAMVTAIEATMEIYPGSDAECRYDHHGYCQSHNLAEKGQCHVELLGAALKLAQEAK